ncbi:MAG: FAD-binding oxidoreductase [Candidatus Saccharimonadales bacterium]|nr:FAD-binding oxidoreductase [Candidatus Saccharibacteria bacterium]
MSKVAHYLQEHLLGEVMTSVDARRYFATDSSIFTLAPSIIVYPRNENDVRKTTRFAWQLAERGRIIPITARGSGTDYAGAALGNGIMLVFPAHMNRIVELDQKTGVVVVEPGLNYGRMQQTLQTHERFLPPYPASIEFSTIGGAVGNNASGEKSVKYGVTRDYVKSLRVVLANGEVIETRRLTRRELSKKLGLTTFEGEIYRSLDTLIEENREAIDKSVKNVTKNTAGYNLFDVKRRDGSFDLTPLLVGAQGTLGVISEITCETEAFNPETAVFAAFFDSISALGGAVQELRKLSQMPSAIEMVDGKLLSIVNELNPNQLKDIIPASVPAAALVVEFDNTKDRKRRKTLKLARKIFEKHAAEFKEESEPAAQAKLWKIRHASASLLSHSDNQTKSVPIIEDGVVPVEKLEEFVSGIYALFKSAQLDVAIWGHAGDGNLHVHPFLDIAQLGDRQKAFRLMEEYYELVISLGGSTTGQHNDGRLRGPYLEKLYGSDVYNVFKKLKQIFDPYGILNPGVKVGISTDDVRPLLRTTYSLDHLYKHMPRS